MNRRSASEAVQEFLDSLQQAVSCVTDTVLNNGGGYYPSSSPHTVFLPDSPVELQAARPDIPRLALVLSHEYQVVLADGAGPRGPYAVHTRGYRYALRLRGGPEVIAYHWHPARPNPITFPHLHLEAGAGIGFSALTKAHLPTSRIALEDVLRLAIRDLGVKPERPDWEGVLDRIQETFRATQPWA